MLVCYSSEVRQSMHAPSANHTTSLTSLLDHVADAPFAAMRAELLLRFNCAASSPPMLGTTVSCSWEETSCRVVGKGECRAPKMARLPPINRRMLNEDFFPPASAPSAFSLRVVECRESGDKHVMFARAGGSD
jgi:hypothetical protein